MLTYVLNASIEHDKRACCYIKSTTFFSAALSTSSHSAISDYSFLIYYGTQTSGKPSGSHAQQLKIKENIDNIPIFVFIDIANSGQNFKSKRKLGCQQSFFSSSLGGHITFHDPWCGPIACFWCKKKLFSVLYYGKLPFSLISCTMQESL